jgi:hypothetical protein
MIKHLTTFTLLPAALALVTGEVAAQGTTMDGRPPFTATLSNQRPLVFGMDVEQASAALKQPLQYVSGPPGNEIYLALRNLGGSGLINHHDRLFLQFRDGRLAGWKEDFSPLRHSGARANPESIYRHDKLQNGFRVCA